MERMILLSTNPEPTAQPSQEGSRPQAAHQELLSQVKQMDKGLLLTLLKNPQTSSRLRAEDLVYGLAGALSSVIGFLLWALLMQKKIEDSLYGLFGFGLFSSGASPLGGAFSFKLFLIGLISLAAIVLSVWTFGRRFGDSKPSLQETAVQLGAMQLASGAGFVLAGLLAFLSIKLSLLLLAAVLLISLVMTVMAAGDHCRVSAERKHLFTSLSVSCYLAIMLVAVAILF